ncbi:unnamed protein product [Amoebophrya sp. A25]|nr:unnamed protein product [Amoebophrya sp. A25]|eukprot:GSA25T00021575001.1
MLHDPTSSRAGSKDSAQVPTQKVHPYVSSVVALERQLCAAKQFGLGLNDRSNVRLYAFNRVARGRFRVAVSLSHEEHPQDLVVDYGLDGAPVATFLRRFKEHCAETANSQRVLRMQRSKYLHCGSAATYDPVVESQMVFHERMCTVGVEDMTLVNVDAEDERFSEVVPSTMNLALYCARVARPGQSAALASRLKLLLFLDRDCGDLLHARQDYVLSNRLDTGVEHVDPAHNRALRQRHGNHSRQGARPDSTGAEQAADEEGDAMGTDGERAQTAEHPPSAAPRDVPEEESDMGMEPGQETVPQGKMGSRAHPYFVRTAGEHAVRDAAQRMALREGSAALQAVETQWRHHGVAPGGVMKALKGNALRYNDVRKYNGEPLVREQWDLLRDLTANPLRDTLWDSVRTGGPEDWDAADFYEPYERAYYAAIEAKRLAEEEKEQARLALLNGGDPKPKGKKKGKSKSAATEEAPAEEAPPPSAAPLDLGMEPTDVAPANADQKGGLEQF